MFKSWWLYIGSVHVEKLNQRVADIAIKKYTNHGLVQEGNNSIQTLYIIDAKVYPLTCSRPDGNS